MWASSVPGPDSTGGPWAVALSEQHGPHRRSEDVQNRVARSIAPRRHSVFSDLRFAFDLRHRLSAGGVADEWVTQLLRQGDAKVFKKYSQMKLMMKREALQKINRQANEQEKNIGTAKPN